jgi:hypothetical protein
MYMTINGSFGNRLNKKWNVLITSLQGNIVHTFALFDGGLSDHFVQRILDPEIDADRGLLSPDDLSLSSHTHPPFLDG